MDVKIYMHEKLTADAGNFRKICQYHIQNLNAANNLLIL